MPLTSTCHQFHSLILRLIHNRLQIAAGLNGSTLYLECNHPSARLTAARLFCTSLGTDGLDDLLSDIYDEHKYVGQIKRLGSMYSRFRPQKHEPDFRVSVRHPAGDIPGSRTYRDPNGAAAVPSDEDEIVRDTVTVDAHDLFSQLMTVAYLGKREWTKGLLISLQEIAEGTIRVWRDWLSKHCESRSFSDQSTVTIQQGTSAAKGKTRSDSVTDVHDPSQDPRVLWVNTRGNDVGVKFKVKRQKQRTTNMPLLFSSDVEVSVSYVVEFEGKLSPLAAYLNGLLMAIRGLRSHCPSAAKARGSRNPVEQ